MTDVDDKTDPADDLPLERIERFGDYFKLLFVRSLRLGLEGDRQEFPGASRPPVAPEAAQRGEEGSPPQDRDAR